MFVSRLCALTLVALAVAQSAVGQTTRDTDILVMFNPGGISLPVNQLSVPIEEAGLSSDAASVLQRAGALLISRAAPGIEIPAAMDVGPDGNPVPVLDLSRLYRISFPAGSDLDRAVSELGSSSGIAYAERIPRIEFFSTYPNDPHFNLQWGLHNTGQAGGQVDADIDAPKAWDLERGQSTVKIGIIDTGVQQSHEDLSGKVFGESVVSGPHGTHVAGIAAAKTNNGIGVAGVSWNSPIHSEEIGSFDAAEIYRDIRDAVQAGAFVLNNSWGGTDYSVTIRAAFAYAYKMGRLSIASTGNDYAEIRNYPAGWDHGVLAVGAVTNLGERSPFSTYGDYVDVVAPGGIHPYPNTGPEDILSTWAEVSRPYEYVAGTSMAAPFATGVAALVKSYRPELENDDVMKIIELSAFDLNSPGLPGWDKYIGFGLIKAAKALELLRPPYSLLRFSVSGGTDVESPSVPTTFFTVPGLADGYYYPKRHRIEKQVSFGEEYVFAPSVWGRGVSTAGYSAENPNFGMGWCQPVPGTVTKTGCRLMTYAYEVYNVIGQFVGWYPCPPGNVSMKYSVHGIVDEGPPGVVVEFPNGGEIFRTLDVVRIRWRVEDEYLPGTSSNIYFNKYLPGGFIDVVQIAINRPVDAYGNGSYDWQIPAGQGTFTTCKIRVASRDMNNHWGEDESDGYFTVAYASKPVNEPIPEGASGRPLKNHLRTPLPNPFNPSASIGFEIAEAAPVYLRLYDVRGSLVKSFYAGTMLSAGEHRMQWDGRNDRETNIPSGIYFLELRVGGYRQCEKLVKLD